MFGSRDKIKKAKAPIVSKSADHQRLVALINSMTDGVLAVDGNGRIMLTNSAALGLLDTNTLVNKKLGSALHLIDKKGRDINAQTLLSDKSRLSSRDLSLKYSDGTTINLELNVTPVRLGFGFKDGGYVMLLRDITQEKSLEEEREEFISVASHELRTPIAITEGNISNALLLAQKAGSSDTITQALSSAHSQIVFLGGLINDLAMLSRAERGGLALKLKAINVAELIDGLCESYQSQANEKKLKLSTPSASKGLSLYSSELYLREILQNFITNSIKYTEKGEVVLSAEKQSGGIKFSVKDSGIGISKGEQKKLFTKFFRSEDWRVQKVSGSGLGLYVSEKLAKLLKGEITVESELEKGSDFSFFAPDLTNGA